MDKTKQRPNLESSRVVYVEWVDAVADLGWEQNSKASLHMCYTVGYLIDETKDALLIASTVSQFDSNARMHIPKAWIRNRRNITTKQNKVRRKQNQTIISEIKRSRIAAVDSRSTNIEVSN